MNIFPITYCTQYEIPIYIELTHYEYILTKRFPIIERYTESKIATAEAPRLLTVSK